jgi:hypothetical protein
MDNASIISIFYAIRLAINIYVVESATYKECVIWKTHRMFRLLSTECSQNFALSDASLMILKNGLSRLNKKRLGSDGR